MLFNPDINKQAVQVIFSQKRNTSIHPPLFFNEAPVVMKYEQKHDDIIYHKVDPELSLDFTKKLEATQYSATLGVSGAWRRTNKCKLYGELGWENLYHRRWYRRLTHFFKLRQSKSPLYLYNLIPSEREVNYNLRRIYTFDQRVERTNRYANTNIQNCLKGWNQLDITLDSSQTISEFKRRPIQLVKPRKRSIFNIKDLDRVKLLNRLRVEFQRSTQS